VGEGADIGDLQLGDELASVVEEDDAHRLACSGDDGVTPSRPVRPD